MKISCQSCHSKYNVADEKIQGKIVKIRCRKCGATIVVNASAGIPANGSTSAAHAPAGAGAVAAVASAVPASADEWHVSIADDDQRTMTLADLISAYNSGIVSAETFIWTDGMQDWKALAEVDAVVSALHAAASKAEPAARGGYGLGGSAQMAKSPTYEAPAARQAFERPAAAHGGGAVAQVAAPAALQEPKRAAVVKRDARARDLFATRTGEELNAAVAGLNEEDARLTGQRNENSVLFSLQHLTKSSEDRSAKGPSSHETDDSGVIDLKALAAKAESMRPVAMPDQNHLAPPLGFVSPLAAHLGSPGYGSDAQPKSKLPLLIGGGAGIALLLVLGIVIGLKMGGLVGPGPGVVANAPTFPIPSATPSATAEPTATASASAASTSSAAPVAATKPHAYGGGGIAPHPGGGAKPQGGGGGGTAAGGGAAGASTAGGAAAGAGGGATPTPAPKKNDCGCNGDLMCMMKCSTH
jgi:predicted Zn finger-like uncharacterized protein